MGKRGSKKGSNVAGGAGGSDGGSGNGGPGGWPNGVPGGFINSKHLVKREQRVSESPPFYYSLALLTYNRLSGPPRTTAGSSSTPSDARLPGMSTSRSRQSSQVSLHPCPKPHLYLLTLNAERPTAKAIQERLTKLRAEQLEELRVMTWPSEPSMRPVNDLPPATSSSSPEPEDSVSNVAARPSSSDTSALQPSVPAETAHTPTIWKLPAGPHKQRRGSTAPSTAAETATPLPTTSPVPAANPFLANPFQAVGSARTTPTRRSNAPTMMGSTPYQLEQQELAARAQEEAEAAEALFNLSNSADSGEKEKKKKRKRT